MTVEERWLAAMWPKVRAYLPPSPAMIVEVGCGPFGGFVPWLRDSGYQAIGIDPRAPEGDLYSRIEFERSELSGQVDGIVACTSLHHVDDPDEVAGKIARALVPGGLMIVVEWDWEAFDEATARWCFERLQPSGSDTWLQHRRDQWSASDRTWDQYLRGWADEHHLHGARRLLRSLDRHFQRVLCDRGPYFFAKLSATSEADEQKVIEAGQIRALRIDYVGRLR